MNTLIRQLFLYLAAALLCSAAPQRRFNPTNIVVDGSSTSLLDPSQESVNFNGAVGFATNQLVDSHLGSVQIAHANQISQALSIPKPQLRPSFGSFPANNFNRPFRRFR